MEAVIPVELMGRNLVYQDLLILLSNQKLKGRNERSVIVHSLMTEDFNSKNKCVKWLFCCQRLFIHWNC